MICVSLVDKFITFIKAIAYIEALNLVTTYIESRIYIEAIAFIKTII